MDLDPTTYGLGQILTSPLVLIGLALILGGLGALVWMFRERLGYYEPEIPAVNQRAHAVAPIDRRPDTDTGVIRPPWAPLDTYRDAPTFVPRTEETVVLPVVEPVVDLKPQYAALGRFFAAVDEARADTDEAMDRIAAEARPDCPLTTQEIPPLLDAPLYDTTVRRADTQDLSAVMEKVRKA